LLFVFFGLILGWGEKKPGKKMFQACVAQVQECQSES